MKPVKKYNLTLKQISKIALAGGVQFHYLLHTVLQQGAYADTTTSEDFEKWMNKVLKKDSALK